MDSRRRAALDILSLLILTAVLVASFTGALPWWSFAALAGGALLATAAAHATRIRVREYARVYELPRQRTEYGRVDGL